MGFQFLVQFRSIKRYSMLFILLYLNSSESDCFWLCCHTIADPLRQLNFIRGWLVDFGS